MENKRYLRFLASVVFLLVFVVQGAYSVDHLSVRGGQVLNCYGWTYKQITDNLQAIKDANFTGVQVTSVQPLLPKETKELWRGPQNIKDITVYVKKSSETAPYLWFWGLSDGNSAETGAWPGRQLRKQVTIDGQDYWYETFKTNNLNFLINSGNEGVQTADIAATKDIVVEFLPDDTYQDGENTRAKYNVLSEVTPIQADITVFSKANFSPYLHAWNGSGDLYNGGWPGQQMYKQTTIAGEKYYYDTFKESSISYIFNNNAGVQTSNIEGITSDVVYETTLIDNSYTAGEISNPGKTIETTATDGFYVYCKASSAPYIHIWGTSDKHDTNWSDCPQMTEKTTINGEDYWTYFFDGVPSANFLFKNAKGDGQQSKDFKLVNVSRLYTYDGSTTADFVNKNNITVYCKASSAPNIWAWNSDGDYNDGQGWPGPQMTEITIDGETYYTKTYTNVPYLNFKFNNNGGQESAEYAAYDDVYLNYNPSDGSSSQQLCLYVSATTAPHLVVASSDWNTRYNGDEVGNELTQQRTLDGITYYYYRVNQSDVHLIFNDGQWGQFEHQTANIDNVSGIHTYTFRQEEKDPAAPEITTIYCQADDAPYLYTYGDELNGGWPGTQMTKQITIDGNTYWYEAFLTNKFNIIFNNGNGSQTEDIKEVSGDRFFTYNGGTGYTNTTGTAVDKKIALYIKDPSQAPYLFACDKDWNTLNGEYPGQKLVKQTSISGESYYYDILLNSELNYIFNNGNSGTGYQSPDFHTTASKFHESKYESQINNTEVTLDGEYAPSWAFVYQPLGFRIADNMFGTAAEFKALVSAAHEKRLGVVVGVEANSVSNKEDLLDANVKPYLRKDYNDPEDWDLADRKWITHHPVNVYDGASGDYVYDLKTEETGLQSIVKTFIDELDNAGVDGVCWYHAKYIGLRNGLSYQPEKEGLDAPAYPAVKENDTFWKNITDYLYGDNDSRGMWCYGEIGVDPYYKNGKDANSEDASSYACQYSNPEGKDEFRHVREYRLEMDINDAYYMRMGIKDGGANYGNVAGYWEWKTLAKKMHKGQTITEILSGQRAAQKADLVYANENADTYLEIQPEMYVKDGYQEQLSSFEKEQIWMDRAYARLAGQDESTIVYFSRPADRTQIPFADEDLNASFKSNHIKELNQYHTLMNGKRENLQEDYNSGQGGNVASLVRMSGAIVLQRDPANFTNNIEAVNGNRRLETGKYKDRLTGNTWTVSQDALNGTMGETGIAILYDEEALQNEYFTVFPNSIRSPYSVIESAGTIKISTGTYPVDVQISNNSNFSNYTSYGYVCVSGTVSANKKEVPYEITSAKFATSKKYRTWVYVRVRAYTYSGSTKYTSPWKYYYYELREDNYKSSDDSGVFHVLYFNLGEGVDPAKFKVNAWSEQFGDAIQLTEKDGNSLCLADGQEYHPVDKVYEWTTGDTEYSDFVGNDDTGTAYNPARGASYCDIYTYASNPKKFYRMTIGVPNLNFDVVQVRCSYDGKQLNIWEVDDDAFFDVQMDAEGNVSYAPMRSLGGEAIYDVNSWNEDDLTYFKYTPSKSTPNETVWTYTGQMEQGKKFRILGPIDYLNNYMQGEGYSTDPDGWYNQPLSVVSTPQYVRIGFTADSEGLTYGSHYTQTQGEYTTAGSGELSGKKDLEFNLPTGLYTIELHEKKVYDAENDVTNTEYFYTVSRPTLTIKNADGQELSATQMELNESRTGWLLTGIEVKDETAVKGNQLIIRDIADESVFTPIVYQVDKKDADVSEANRAKNYSEAGTYRVLHTMGHKVRNGESEEYVAATDKYLLGFNASYIAQALDNDNQNWGGVWTSFSSGKNREIPTDMKAYVVSGVEKAAESAPESFKVFLTEVTGSVPAETPLLLYQADATKEGIHYEKINESNRRIYLADAGTEGSAPAGTNMLRAQVAYSNASLYSGYANYQLPQTVEADGINYVLSYQKVEPSDADKTFGFFQLPSSLPDQNLTYRKAYLHVPFGASKAPARWDAILNFDRGTITSIETTDDWAADNNAPYYNLQGIRVDNPQKGVFIRNGKKVVIK